MTKLVWLNLMGWNVHVRVKIGKLIVHGEKFGFYLNQERIKKLDQEFNFKNCKIKQHQSIDRTTQSIDIKVLKNKRKK